LSVFTLIVQALAFIAMVMLTPVAPFAPVLLVITEAIVIYWLAVGAHWLLALFGV
jgi:hypothetical protein